MTCDHQIDQHLPFGLMLLCLGNASIIHGYILTHFLILSLSLAPHLFSPVMVMQDGEGRELPGMVTGAVPPPLRGSLLHKGTTDSPLHPAQVRSRANIQQCIGCLWWRDMDVELDLLPLVLRPFTSAGNSDIFDVMRQKWRKVKSYLESDPGHLACEVWWFV